MPQRAGAMAREQLSCSGQCCDNERLLLSAIRGRRAADMNDRYLELSQSGWGKSMLEMFGLPTPPNPARPDGPWVDRPFEGQAVLVGASTNAEVCGPLLGALQEAGATL